MLLFEYYMLEVFMDFLRVKKSPIPFRNLLKLIYVLFRILSRADTGNLKKLLSKEKIFLVLFPGHRQVLPSLKSLKRHFCCCKLQKSAEKDIMRDARGLS